MGPLHSSEQQDSSGQTSELQLFIKSFDLRILGLGNPWLGLRRLESAVTKLRSVSGVTSASHDEEQQLIVTLLLKPQENFGPQLWR